MEELKVKINKYIVSVVEKYPCLYKESANKDTRLKKQKFDLIALGICNTLHQYYKGWEKLIIVYVIFLI